jgi:hypothetical protein
MNIKPRIFHAACTVGVASVLIWTASPAHAAGEIVAHHGNDFAVARPYSSSQYEYNIQVWDQEDDGHSVTGQFQYKDPMSGDYRTFDLKDTFNGDNPANEYLPGDVRRVRICEAGVGCSPYSY